MFRPSGTPQYNPKFPNIFIKIERIRTRDIQSRIQNTTIPMYSLETQKIKKIYYIETLNARY